jgi:alpha-D-ribose 1-methylphosphonate 5-triphosphate synthase subunit PhnG
MNRAERAQALARMPAEEAVWLAERLSDTTLGEVEVISPPTIGMVMARAVDGARGQTFNVGEILVTEARVSVAGVEGWGMVMGSAREHALAMAVVDASLEANHPRRAATERLLQRLSARADNQRAEEARRVAPTRVQFETF